MFAIRKIGKALRASLNSYILLFWGCKFNLIF